MLIRAKQLPEALRLFKGIPTHEDPEMKAMRGNPSASILLIAPPAVNEEYASGIPFSNESASIFHAILDANGVSTEKNMLVVSCNRYGLKAGKHTTSPVLKFVMQCAARSLFKLYVCVGDEAFKYIFGHGKKPGMSTLAGSIIYVPETGYAPLFTFPSVAPLAPEPADTDRQDYLNKRIAEELSQKIHQLSLKLVTTLRSLSAI